MPFKHHAEHRHDVPKPPYRVTNGPEYNAALRQRGSLTGTVKLADSETEFGNNLTLKPTNWTLKLSLGHVLVT